MTEADQGYSFGSNTQVTDTPFARLQNYLRNPTAVPKPADPETPQFKGVANPYGSGLAAYEPNTTPYIAETQTSGSDVTKSTVDMPQGVNGISGLPQGTGTSGATSMVPAGNYASGGMVDANGLVQKMINSALQLAANNVPYVWGGTSATGVDCSGLIQYAAKAAGLSSWARYRAQDYGHMGTAVSMDAARPGDVVYYDEGGGNGHVGLYLGNGMMVAAPQTGENVKVQKVYGTPTSIRRIFNDSSFTPVSTPTGGTTYAYNGRPMASPAASPTFNPVTPPPAPPPRVYTPPQTFSSGRVRPI